MDNRKRKRNGRSSSEGCNSSCRDNKGGSDEHSRHSDRRGDKSGSSSGSSSSIDDEKGHVEVVMNETTFKSSRYLATKLLGVGTFGKVLQCLDRKHNDVVAVKVVRKIERYVESAMIEARILNDIYDAQKRSRCSSFVKMYSSFHENSHFCMVFEPLGLSLYDCITNNNHLGLPIHYIRDISRQLLEGLAFLQNINLIHTDLKLENILFTSSTVEEVEHRQRGKPTTRITIPSSSRIKIIDFGGATYDDQHKSRIVNTRQYRGPEVTLEVGWSFPSDIWSAGCIIAEMYSGELLFATHDDLEHLCLMEKMIDYFPRRLIDDSPVKRDFFDRDRRLRYNRLSDDNYYHVQRARRLRDHFDLYPLSAEDERHFAGLMYGLLELDPRRRLTAREALSNRFLET